MQVVSVRNNVKVKSTVTVDLTPDEWQLYTSSFPRQEIERIADFMNKRFNHAYNQGCTKEELRKYMYEIMGLFDKYGAYDTEPLGVLEDLIEKIYPA
jgi:hypothetical protein